MKIDHSLFIQRQFHVLNERCFVDRFVFEIPAVTTTIV